MDKCTLTRLGKIDDSDIVEVEVEETSKVKEIVEDAMEEEIETLKVQSAPMKELITNPERGDYDESTKGNRC